MAAPPEQADSLTGVLYLRLILFGAAIGIPAALVAALFLAAVHEVEHWLWEDLPDQLGASSPPWYLVMGLPVVGAVFVILARTYLPGDGGHSPLEGLGGAPTPLVHAPGIALAGMGTLAFGAVLGPEAPLIALGSAVGIALTHLVALDPREEHVLGTAGSFSAVSALFGGPMVAAILLLEAGVGLGSAVTAVLLPGLVAAAVGYLVFVGLGDWGGLDSTALAIPGLPAYDGTSVFDLAVGLVVGVATALLVTAIRRAAAEIAGPRRWRPSMPVLLLAGGAAVGVLAQLADVLGADSQDVLFSGQESIPGLVVENSSATVLILIAAKGLGYAICLGCGFRGGPVFPALFIGVALAMLAVIAFDVSPTLAVAVGAAAGTVAATRLLFTSLLFAALLVGTAGADAVPAAVFAASAAWVTVTALARRTAETSEAKAAERP